MAGKAKAEPKDKTGAKRQQALRDRKERVEALLEPAEFAEFQAMLTAGEAPDKASLVRAALHEKYLRFAKKKT